MQDSTPRRNSLAGLSSPSIRLNPEILDRKTEQRRKLRNVLQELNQANQKHEVQLTSQLQEFEQKLEVILASKRHATGLYRMKSDSVNTQVSQCNATIRRSDRDLSKLQSRSRIVDAMMNQEHTDKLEAFKYSLKPIQEATELVMAEKQQAEDNIADLTKQMEDLESKLVQLTAEDTKNRKQIETLQNNKVELSTAFETIRNKYPLEYDEIVKEIETKKNLNELKERKNKQASDLRELNDRIDEKERDLKKAVGDLEREQRQRSVSRKRGTDQSDLVQLERYLRLRCSEFHIPYIDQAVQQVATRSGIDVNNCILKEQFKIMEDRELTIIQKGKQISEQAESEVAKKSIDAEQNEQMLLASMSSQESNPQLERKVRELNHNIKKLKKEADQSKRQHACRIALINRWKDENRKCLLAPDNVSWPSDINIVSSVKEYMKEKIENPEQFAAIESILNRYIKSLNQREGLANAASEIQVKANNEIKEKETYIKELKSGISSLQFERDVLQKDITRLLNLEKSTLKKFQNCKYDIEVERFRIITKKVQDSLKKKVPEFLKLQQALGQKNMKHFKDRELSKFKGELENNQRKVRNKLEDLYNNFGYWDGQIQHVLDKSISAQIDEVKNEIKKLSQKVKVQQSQLKILIDAEDELKAKIETMVEAKKKEIGTRVSKIMSENGGGVDFNRMGQLKRIKMEAEEQLKELQNLLQDERIKYGHKMEELEIEETKVNAKLTQLRSEVKVVLMNKKKSATLQLKLVKLEKEMERLNYLEEGTKQEQPQVLAQHDLSEEMKVDDESPEKPDFGDTIESPFASPISMSMQAPQTDNAKVFVDEEGLKENQKKFFQAILPLVEGIEVFKKAPGKYPDYHPILKMSLRACGFQAKILTVNRQLTKLEFRNHERPGIEKIMMIKQVLAPCIPKHTMEVIAAKKKPQIELTEEYEESYFQMVRSGIYDFKSDAFLAKAQTAEEFPFQIGLRNGGKVDLIAADYTSFNVIVKGVNALLKHMDILHRLKYHLKIN